MLSDEDDSDLRQVGIAPFTDVALALVVLVAALGVCAGPYDGALRHECATTTTCGVPGPLMVVVSGTELYLDGMRVDDVELERKTAQQVSRYAEESRAVVAVDRSVSDDMLTGVLRRIRHAGVTNVRVLMPQPQ